MVATEVEQVKNYRATPPHPGVMSDGCAITTKKRYWKFIILLDAAPLCSGHQLAPSSISAHRRQAIPYPQEWNSRGKIRCQWPLASSFLSGLSLAVAGPT